MDRRRSAGDPLTGGDDGVFDVLAEDGGLVRYVPDDFDEIWTTSDEREAGRHVSLGWILLDEVVDPGEGPGHEAFVTRPSGLGSGGLSWRTEPVRMRPDDVLTYVLGRLKPGRHGSPADTSGPGAPGS